VRADQGKIFMWSKLSYSVKQLSRTAMTVLILGVPRAPFESHYKGNAMFGFQSGLDYSAIVDGNYPALAGHYVVLYHYYAETYR
jgi:hypothetical protein